MNLCLRSLFASSIPKISLFLFLKLVMSFRVSFTLPVLIISTTLCLKIYISRSTLWYMYLFCLNKLNRFLSLIDFMLPFKIKCDFPLVYLRCTKGTNLQIFSLDGLLELISVSILKFHSQAKTVKYVFHPRIVTPPLCRCCISWLNFLFAPTVQFPENADEMFDLTHFEHLCIGSSIEKKCILKHVT